MIDKFMGVVWRGLVGSVALLAILYGGCFAYYFPYFLEVITTILVIAASYMLGGFIIDTLPGLWRKWRDK